MGAIARIVTLLRISSQRWLPARLYSVYLHVASSQTYQPDTYIHVAYVWSIACSLFALRPPSGTFSSAPGWVENDNNNSGSVWPETPPPEFRPRVYAQLSVHMWSAYNSLNSIIIIIIIINICVPSRNVPEHGGSRTNNSDGK